MGAMDQLQVELVPETLADQIIQTLPDVLQLLIHPNAKFQYRLPRVKVKLNC